MPANPVALDRACSLIWLRACSASLAGDESIFCVCLMAAEKLSNHRDFPRRLSPHNLCTACHADVPDHEPVPEQGVDHGEVGRRLLHHGRRRCERLPAACSEPNFAAPRRGYDDDLSTPAVELIKLRLATICRCRRRKVAGGDVEGHQIHATVVQGAPRPTPPVTPCQPPGSRRCHCRGCKHLSHIKGHLKPARSSSHDL